MIPDYNPKSEDSEPNKCGRQEKKKKKNEKIGRERERELELYKMERDGERFCSRGSNRMNHTMWNFTSLTEQYHNIVTLTSLQYHNIDLEKAYDRVPREIL